MLIHYPASPRIYYITLQRVFIYIILNSCSIYRYTFAHCILYAYWCKCDCTHYMYSDIIYMNVLHANDCPSADLQLHILYMYLPRYYYAHAPRMEALGIYLYPQNIVKILNPKYFTAELREWYFLHAVL